MAPRKKKTAPPLDKLNVIVTCPKAFRCFEPATGRMYYEPELIKMGVAMTPTGKLFWVNGELAGRQILNMFPLWNTSMRDTANEPLYEGDICEIEVDTGFGSVTQRMAIMRWVPEGNCFSLVFNGRTSFAGGVTIRTSHKVGNEYQHKDVAERWRIDNE